MVRLAVLEHVWPLLGMGLLLCLILTASAVTTLVQSSNYQAEFGASFQITNLLAWMDKGFSTTTTTALATQCLVPVPFGPVAGTANTQISSGDWVFDVQVNTTGTTPANAHYNATLVLGSTTYGPLCIATGPIVQAGQAIDCMFDVGSSLPASVYAFKLTVA